MTHEQIIDKLDGTRAVMDAVNAALPGKKPLALSSVSVWKTRGIPWRYRALIARMARERNILLPADFLLADAA